VTTGVTAEIVCNICTCSQAKSFNFSLTSHLLRRRIKGRSTLARRSRFIAHLLTAHHRTERSIVSHNSTCNINELDTPDDFHHLLRPTPSRKPLKCSLRSQCLVTHLLVMNIVFSFLTPIDKTCLNRDINNLFFFHGHEQSLFPPAFYIQLQAS